VQISLTNAPTTAATTTNVTHFMLDLGEVLVGRDRARLAHARARAMHTFESKNDYNTMYMFARKFGFAEKMFKNIKVENCDVSAEDILREINRGGWSTVYCGQSPERLKAHMRNQHKFDLVTLCYRARRRYLSALPKPQRARNESAPLDRLATRQHLPQTRRVPRRGDSQRWSSAGASPVGVAWRLRRARPHPSRDCHCCGRSHTLCSYRAAAR
jgi:hypothetical protein